MAKIGDGSGVQDDQKARYGGGVEAHSVTVNVDGLLGA